MYAQTSANIELPSVFPRQAPTALFEGSAIQPVSFFSPGAEIYAQGEKVKAIYEVEFGAVRVYRLLADGRRQISAFHFAGETFGFEGDAMHHFFAEAINSTSVRVFRIGSGTDLSHHLLPLALKGLTRAQEHLLVLGRQNAIERVAAFLLDMAERQGDLRQIDLPMSRIDIGDYLGLTIETVSRVFSRLKEKGVIRLHSLRRIEMLKRDTLRAMGE
ncbi:MAG: helix-turn-helix domain-containing protein [Aquamicrobium sp.]|uniref:helix-turn-helix domain-containing protein n=1 Tax=Mesorhizobium sp. Pch-S TaxID=2082387 RepID=UPI00101359B9|nr:helix-turn-helix domain-containing protein [Mesorhizobium sp. Pch-S]MBR2691031.1 helix-turn-helix domain-containing protein [Aquamicrobium sp.]QAZ44244.1 transcriptional regulator [Mesorhizobium sp. Pch-S]